MPWQAPSYSKITRGERSQRGSGASREASRGLSPSAARPRQRQRGHPRSLRGQRCPARPGPAGSPPEAAGSGAAPGERPAGRGGALGRASARAPGGERPRRRERCQRPGTGSPRRPPPPPSVCLLCSGTVPPARPSVRRPLTAPPAPPRNSCLNSACARGVRGCPPRHPPRTAFSFPKRGGEGGGITGESDEELPPAHREYPGDPEGSRASWKGTDPKRRGKSAGRERHMDDDDEDEDEDGDGDPDAPPAPAAPLLLTSASSTSASHRWPQPPPTSTVRHIDTATDRPPPPPLPRPHTAPAPPAHRPSPGADTHPPPRRPHGLGWGRAGLRGNRGAGPGRDAAPRGAPRTPPRTAPRPLPQRSPTLSRSCYFLSFISPWKRRSPFWLRAAALRTRAALRRTRLRGQRSVPAPAALAPPEPRGAPGEAAGARRRERSPFPPPRVCGSGRCRRGEPRAPRGMGRREGAEFSAVCEGDKVWGAWPLSSSSGWNSCGRSGRGGAPRAGARLAGCLPARLRGGVKPHYTGFNVSRRPAGTRAPRGGGGAPRPRSRRKVRPRGEEAAAPPDFPPGRCPGALRCPRRERLRRSAAAGPGPPRRAPPQGHP
ncbi:translation initiation factor IF-2-like [Motacilla alba alba]|uniref:translation initiation factor IF-2-like n=1 Tax=Motacilla alba alba TaxID=1094192 RepID=UPI0018D56AAD|nr:translation initiation factor IF-2-like [Motacilla alba alba]